MQFEFDEQKCREAKAKLNSFSKDISDKIGDIWKDNFSYPKYIGNCSELYNKLSPTGYDDFYVKYLKYAKDNHHLSIKKRGIDYDKIVKESVRYKNMVFEKTGVDEDVSTFFYDMVCHIIVETFDGKKKEEKFRSYLERLGYSTSIFEGEVDMFYGTDIKVICNDGTVFAVQIKPLSFFTSKRSDTMKDNAGLCRKYKKTLSEFGIETYYAIYDKNKWDNKTWWLHKSNGKLCFKINDLFEYDPNNIDGAYKRKKLPNTFKEL